jgi:hypothetical protein
LEQLAKFIIPTKCLWFDKAAMAAGSVPDLYLAACPRYDSLGLSATVDLAHFALSPERWQIFCAALDAPPREIPALRKFLAEASLCGEHGSAAP